MHGRAFVRGALCEFNLPFEAADHFEAYTAGAAWLEARHGVVVEIKAHRCSRFERQLAEFVAGVLADVWGARRTAGPRSDG